MRSVTEPAMTDQEAEDRVAIRELLLRYARGVDGRDLEVVASCFAPDAEYRGALATGTIDDALAALRIAIGRYRATRHAITAHTMDVNGDRARSSAECTAHHWFPDGTCRTVGVRYDDDLVRLPDGWRIARRNVEQLWTRGTEARDA